MSPPASRLLGLKLDRPPCGPPPGQRRPWEWLDSEPVTERERRLASLPPQYEARAAAIERPRRAGRTPRGDGP